MTGLNFKMITLRNMRIIFLIEILVVPYVEPFNIAYFEKYKPVSSESNFWMKYF